MRRRSHLFDTCASIALNGDLVHLEDLVLHDAGTDRRAPTHELTRAARLLALLRRIDRMIRQLGPALPRELTGRDRYRAWVIL